MKNKQNNNLKSEQKRAITALTTVQKQEYIIEQEHEQEQDQTMHELEEGIGITMEDIIHEIEQYIHEIKQDPEKMEAMIHQLAKMGDETPTHLRYKNKIYCERCFIKLMTRKNKNNLTVMGVPNHKNAVCDICGE